MITKKYRSYTRRRGFTLTELAIVLGVIGLILSAVWVSARTVYNNYKVQKAEQELLQVSQAIRGLYATSNIVDDTATTTTYVSAGVFPSDTLTGAAATPSAPWQNSGLVAGPAYAASADDSFYVGMTGIPQNACSALVTATAGQNRDSSLWAVIGGPSSTTAPSGTAGTTGSTFPLSPATVLSTICSGVTDDVYWVYKLKG